MAWKAEVIADSSGQWTANALRFATEAEALGYVKDLYSRWTSVREFRVTECEDEVNRTWPEDRPERTPLPRAQQDLVVEPITDPAQFIRDLMDDVKRLREQGYVCGDGAWFATLEEAKTHANGVHQRTGAIIAIEKAGSP